MKRALLFVSFALAACACSGTEARGGLGAPCAAPSECASELCVSGFCTERCDDDCACPAGHRCQGTSAGFSVCAPGTSSCELHDGAIRGEDAGPPVDAGPTREEQCAECRGAADCDAVTGACLADVGCAAFLRCAVECEDLACVEACPYSPTVNRFLYEIDACWCRGCVELCDGCAESVAQVDDRRRDADCTPCVPDDGYHCDGYLCLQSDESPGYAICSSPCSESVPCTAPGTECYLEGGYCVPSSYTQRCSDDRRAMEWIDSCGNVESRVGCGERQVCQQSGDEVTCRDLLFLPDCSECTGDPDCDGGACRHFTDFPEHRWCSRRCTTDGDCVPAMQCTASGYCAPRIERACSTDHAAIVDRTSCGQVLAEVQRCDADDYCELTGGGSPYCAWRCTGLGGWSSLGSGSGVSCVYTTYRSSSDQCCGTCTYTSCIPGFGCDTWQENDCVGARP